MIVLKRAAVCSYGFPPGFLRVSSGLSGVCREFERMEAGTLAFTQPQHQGFVIVLHTLPLHTHAHTLTQKSEENMQ